MQATGEFMAVGPLLDPFESINCRSCLSSTHELALDSIMTNSCNN